MAINKSLSLKIFALIVLNDLVDSVAQVFLKKGVDVTGVGHLAFDTIGSLVMKGLASPLLWIGILIYALNFFVWILILYKVDLSVAMPVGSSSYIFVPIAATLFLDEHISLLRWVGIALIVLGIHFVSQTKHSETPVRRIKPDV
jgi:drug/metabolite transporter (DMT)-like permease